MVRSLKANPVTDSVLLFDRSTGAEIDLDLRGTAEEAVARLAEHPLLGVKDEVRGPGRPRLGVVSREVSLLPRHWDWLGAQRGGASAAIRRLVDEARRGEVTTTGNREALHRFLWVMAGDLPGFEEAARALDRGDVSGFERGMAAWPADVRDEALLLLRR